MRLALRLALFIPGLHACVTTDHQASAHAIVPLALLEAVRLLDLPTDDGLEEFHSELAVKRLGLNRAVLAQIERYRGLARRDRWIEAEEAAALLRLVGRRRDAALVFAQAGRRAGSLAARRVSPLARWSWRALPVGRDRVGLGLVRRAARTVFGIELRSGSGELVAQMDDPWAVEATPDGAACGFFGSALAELLRTFTSFDGAVLHSCCRGRGDPHCQWRAAAPAEA